MSLAAHRWRRRAACGGLLASLALGARAEDLHRVRVTKAAGSPPVTETRPLPESGRGGGDDGKTVLRALGLLLDRDKDADGRTGNTRPGLEGGPAAVWIFTNLRTSFRAPNAPDAGWSDKVALSGLAYHGSLLLESDDARGSSTLGLEGGYFKDSRWRHVRSGANGVLASERLDADGAWLALWARLYPTEWAFVSISLGAGGYSIDTRVDTNAPAYAYDGLAGSRAIGLAGLGAGLTTPLRWRLAANVEGRWFFAGSGESRIETGGAIVSANLKARF